MVRSAPVSLLRCLFLFAILLIFFTHTASAEGSDFEISEGSDWSLDYFDGNSLQSSGNESASDGDYVSLNIPVYNSNVSSNNAFWSFSFGNSGLWYGGHSGVLSGNQSISDVEVFFGPLDEGIIFCKLIIGWVKVFFRTSSVKYDIVTLYEAFALHKTSSFSSFFQERLGT